jgi:hypothetical protein
VSKRRLIPHPDYPAPPVEIGAKVTYLGTSVLKLEYVAVGAISELRLPAVEEPARTEGLWHHSCFEAFIALSDDRSYVEYNFAPSRQWAVYRFEAYRSGMHEPHLRGAPDIFAQQETPVRYRLTAFVELAWLAADPPKKLGLSAVLEHRSGTKSYWALAHPPGKPDFHHSDCFTLELPPPA